MLKPGLDCGLWTVDYGLWTVDCGLWTVDCVLVLSERGGGGVEVDSLGMI